MQTPRRIHVSCPDCHVVYSIPTITMLPIARCGRCHGAVIPERAADEILAPTATSAAA